MAETNLMAIIENKIDKMKEPILTLLKDSHAEKVKSELMRKYNAKVEEYESFYRIYITK